MYMNKPVLPQQKANFQTDQEECKRGGYILSQKFLGKGAYARVYAGTPTKEKWRNNYKLKALSPNDNNFNVAIKILDVDSAPETYMNKFLPREIASMSKCCGHANVIKLLDIFATRRKVYMVMEFAKNGDLLKFINSKFTRKTSGGKRGEMSEITAKRLFKEIMAAVHHIHSLGVVHRDLKCENILIGEDEQVKISDFGFAVGNYNDTDLLKTHCGSYVYAAPELLRKKNYYGKEVDMWSLGVILFALIHGGLPFKGKKANDVLHSMRGKIFFKPTISAECKDLIRCLMKVNPLERMNAFQVFHHPWMTTKDETTGSSSSSDVENFQDFMMKQTRIQENFVNWQMSLYDPIFSKMTKFDDPVYVKQYLNNTVIKEDQHQRVQARLMKKNQTNKAVLPMLEAGETGNQQGKILDNNAEENNSKIGVSAKRADGETPIYFSRMWQKKTVTFEKKAEQVAEFEDKKVTLVNDTEVKSSEICKDNITMRAAKRQSLKEKNKQKNKMHVENNDLIAAANVLPPMKTTHKSSTRKKTYFDRFVTDKTMEQNENDRLNDKKLTYFDRFVKRNLNDEEEIFEEEREAEPEEEPVVEPEPPVIKPVLLPAPLLNTPRNWPRRKKNVCPLPRAFNVPLPSKGITNPSNDDGLASNQDSNTGETKEGTQFISKYFPEDDYNGCDNDKSLEEQESIKVIFQKLPSYVEAKVTTASQPDTTINKKYPSYSSRMWINKFAPELSRKSSKADEKSKNSFSANRSIEFEVQKTKDNKNFSEIKYYDESSKNLNVFQHDIENIQSVATYQKSVKKRTYFQRFVLDKMEEEETINRTNDRTRTYFERFSKF